MRVLIVGCGYVGLPLALELARTGHEVFGLRRSPAAAGDLEAAGVQALTADITRPEDLARLPAAFDWVVNCVASGGGSAEDYRRTYLRGTRNLLEWLVPAPPRKFVYTSSTSVYGQNDGSWVGESAPTRPATETAQVLVETEELLLEAARRNRFPAVVLRVAGIYGPDRGYWLRRYLDNEAKLEDEGARILNMIHRDDVVGCIIAALEHGKPGEVYNAADDEPVSQRDLFGWLAGTLGGRMPPSTPEIPEAQKRGPTHKRVSNHKLKTELGYQFKYPDFRKGFAEELRRLREQDGRHARLA